MLSPLLMFSQRLPLDLLRCHWCRRLMPLFSISCWWAFITIIYYFLSSAYFAIDILRWCRYAATLRRLLKLLRAITRCCAADAFMLRYWCFADTPLPLSFLSRRLLIRWWPPLYAEMLMIAGCRFSYYWYVLRRWCHDTLLPRFSPPLRRRYAAAYAIIFAIFFLLRCCRWCCHWWPAADAAAMTCFSWLTCAAATIIIIMPYAYFVVTPKYCHWCRRHVFRCLRLSCWCWCCHAAITAYCQPLRHYAATPGAITYAFFLLSLLPLRFSCLLRWWGRYCFINMPLISDVFFITLRCYAPLMPFRYWLRHYTPCRHYYAFFRFIFAD